LLRRAPWTTLGIASLVLGVGSTLLTPSGLAATEGRALRVADGGGRDSVVVPATGGGATESVGSSFTYLAARASGAPLAQVQPTPGPTDNSVRVILAPDARGPLPPAVTMPVNQLPATVASSVSTPNGVLASTSVSGAMLASSTNSTTAGTSTGSSSRITNLPATASGARIVNIAQSQLGARYTWAGVSPATGFDCSGFVYYVLLTVGHAIPRTMDDQLAAGRRVRLEELRPGDVLFYADTYTSGLSHNAIYIGDRKMIHAVDESTGVAITPVDSAYWDQRFVTAVRFMD
jgi:cell wall-associated NlpC family hydrolase